MWEQYKRTFAFMQSAIAVFTVAIYLTLHHLVLLAALFFVVMQLAAVVVRGAGIKAADLHPAGRLYKLVVGATQPHTYMHDALGLSVSIDHRERGGTVHIRYSDLEQLDEVLRRLDATG